MLKIHEHIIEVSNPQDDLAGIFDSSTLWRHLEHFARHPSEYVEAMKQCSVSEHYENEQLLLKRELDFGGLIVSDTVTFDLGRAVITNVNGSKDYPASRFTIQIESPGEAGYFFLRFIYEEDIPETPAQDIYLQLRKQAYEQKDRDLVDRIRQSAHDLALTH